MDIVNKQELNIWIFEHSNIQGHTCKGIKGILFDDEVNVAFVDTSTNERIDVIYGNNHAQ